MAYPPLLFLPLLLLLPVFFHFTLKKKKTKNNPPGPPGLPIIGNLHQIGTLPHSSLWKLSKKYGDVMLLNFGSVPYLCISSAEAAKEILKTHDLKTCTKPDAICYRKLSYDYLDMIVAPYGDYWRNIRKICAVELFSSKRVESSRFIREEEVCLMIDSISKSASSYSSSSPPPVDLSEKTMTFTSNVVCRVAFGKSFREREFNFERLQEVIHEALSMLGAPFLADMIPYVGWIVDRMSGLHSRLEKNFQEFDVFSEKIIDHHIKNGTNNTENGERDVIDTFLEIERSQNDFAGGIQFSKANIKAILKDIFLAGLDTGAVILAWAMAELVKNPRVMKKAQEEIRNYIRPKEKVTESEINKFGYLKMVLKETLRLHPPGSFLFPREVMQGFGINGYEIYPKTRILINVCAIGRDPKIWENPEEFCPERFIGNNPIEYKEQNYFEMLPFGEGRRGCPGAPMGMAMVELALANLLYCFDWKLPNNMKAEDLNMEEIFGLTTYKKEPLLLVPVKYQFAN